MNFCGEIVFSITDDDCIEVDFGTDIMPTKIIHKGDIIILRKKAPKNRWIYELKYNNEKEFIESLEKILNQLCNKRKYIKYLGEIYDEVNFSIYVRSEFAQIGFSLPSYILKKISSLDCTLNFDILSFGKVPDK